MLHTGIEHVGKNMCESVSNGDAIFMKVFDERIS